jgi:hypothetical protein
MVWKWSSILCISLNDLKDSERGVRTEDDRYQEGVAANFPKSGNSFKVYKLVARDHQVT